MYRQVAPTGAPEGTYIMAHFWKCTKYRYSRYFVSSGCPSPSGRPAIEGSGSFAPRSHKIGTYRHFGPPAFGPCLSASPIKRLSRGPLNSVSTILSVQKTIPQNRDCASANERSRYFAQTVRGSFIATGGG